MSLLKRSVKTVLGRMGYQLTRKPLPPPAASPQPAEDVIAPFCRLPLDRVAAERPRHTDGMLGLPPCGQRLRIEEGIEHLRWRRDDDQVGRELEHATLCTFHGVHR